ncbi:MAG: rhomboid family intramembrane serine protease [Flavobacteriales bacterium]|nr:rhomboid family intramembrane serine protease [Flavobacteriales bacterium]
MLRSIPVVIRNLIIINVLFYLGTLAMTEMFMSMFAGFNFLSPFFKPWQVVTHMFMHSPVSFFHILFNMYGLWMFGANLEHRWGGKKFLIYYMICGLGAFVLHEAVMLYEIHQLVPDISFSRIYDYFHGAPIDAAHLASRDALQAAADMANVPTVGASGAVFGVLLGFGLLFPNAELIMLPIPIPIKARTFVIIYGALELFLGLQQGAETSVAHFAHVGGLVVGFLVLKYWQWRGIPY